MGLRLEQAGALRTRDGRAGGGVLHVQAGWLGSRQADDNHCHRPDWQERVEHTRTQGQPQPEAVSLCRVGARGGRVGGWRGCGCCDDTEKLDHLAPPSYKRCAAALAVANEEHIMRKLNISGAEMRQRIQGQRWK